MRMAEGGLLQERLAVEAQGEPRLLHEPVSAVELHPVACRPHMQ